MVSRPGAALAHALDADRRVARDRHRHLHRLAARRGTRRTALEYFHFTDAVSRFGDVHRLGRVCRALATHRGRYGARWRASRDQLFLLEPNPLRLDRHRNRVYFLLALYRGERFRDRGAKCRIAAIWQIQFILLDWHRVLWRG